MPQGMDGSFNRWTPVRCKIYMAEDDSGLLCYDKHRQCQTSNTKLYRVNLAFVKSGFIRVSPHLASILGASSPLPARTLSSRIGCRPPRHCQDANGAEGEGGYQFSGANCPLTMRQQRARSRRLGDRGVWQE